MLKKITSKDNNIIKLVRSLKDKKARNANNLFIVEGYKFIFKSEIYKSEFLVITDELLDHIERDVALTSEFNSLLCDIYVVPLSLFEYISGTKNPQGALCVFKKDDFNLTDILDDLKENKNISIAVCENLQDPGNAGTIIRTADAAGFDLVLFTNNSVDIFNPKVLRSTAGSFLNVMALQLGQSEEVIKTLNEYGITTYGTALNAKEFYTDVKYDEKTAIFIGNEANGLLSDTISLLDEKIKIQMIGKSESLNASVACGIMMYEVARKNLFNY